MVTVRANHYDVDDVGNLINLIKIYYVIIIDNIK